jgi:3-hydroxyisobutyrate dehydrogenase-like beta-hydroxyacid dehydrogenase
MTCLLHPEQAREVYSGPQGALEQVTAGRIFIEFATVEPALSREIGAAVARRALPRRAGRRPAGVAAGTLSIMVGASPEAHAAARPVLAILGDKLFHLGPVGAGTTVKLSKQMLTGVTHALVAEAMVLGCTARIDARAMFEVLRVSSGQSDALERALPNFNRAGDRAGNQARLRLTVASGRFSSPGISSRPRPGFVKSTLT